ncbi:unnamed protein product [Clavelina lepadiformis]|uniref:Uncharacterized protein n=1 Tax=Clavelina lepadiformis TaxID=159417 RepID=A0ABP0GUF6_CLALP
MIAGDCYGCIHFGSRRYGEHRLASMLLVNQSPIQLTGKLHLPSQSSCRGYLSSIQPGLDRPADQLSVSLLENPLANQRRKLQKPYNYTTALPSPLLRHITAR